MWIYCRARSRSNRWKATALRIFMLCPEGLPEGVRPSSGEAPKLPSNNGMNRLQSRGEMICEKENTDGKYPSSEEPGANSTGAGRSAMGRPFRPGDSGQRLDGLCRRCARHRTGQERVMTEDRTLGGTCLNRGCVPSKNLIGAAQLVYDSSHPRYPGLQSAPMTFNMPELIEQKDELIRTYRQQHHASLLARDGMPGPRVVYGHATLVDPHTIEVRASDGSLHHLRGEQILIATGSSPFLPDITGLAETPYLTSDLLSSRERCL